MHHHVLKIAAVSSMFLLFGCHTTNTPNPVADVFNFAAPPMEVNLAQSVQNALVNSGDPMIGQVRVQTVQNTVILSGYVKKIRQSDTAEQIARKTPGVQNVENRIIIRP